MNLIVMSGLLAFATAQAAAPVELARLERGYWLHASLGQETGRNYWRANLPPDPPPTQEQIQNAARLLTGEYAGNCLYLMYHQEVPFEQFEQAMRCWRQACPKEVEIVPTLNLLMYDKEQTRVFKPGELRRVLQFCKEHINARSIGWYDVMPDRPQQEELAILNEYFPQSIIRVGIQPEEKIDPRCSRVVEDTWSGLCAGKTNEDWASPGFGREFLLKWIEFRRGSKVPVSFDLIVVAWDYLPTARGEFPGYDDASRNMPLPAGRNGLAARLILDQCDPKALAGFSSDLFILQANSKHKTHDGPENSFYQTLKRGEPYNGYYAVPFKELTLIYRQLRGGKPIPLPPTTTRAAASAPAK